MSKADEIRAKALQQASRQVERPSGTGHQVVQKVRRTVDLSPDQHRQLNRLCERFADELGRARVNSQDLLATLVDELIHNSMVQDWVKAKLPEPRRRGSAT